ncbi:bifunctional hydroxymethylpyrimidine kinase/phosphomethylpyrimidine kinase [Nonomuraea sp. MG754425]|uniref:bifunctional hydroxymethylpyrimidine kinase/phosphomethylpyrimidine kinase n=1 Tax=Nonomuraea sp. MG754425 TaxID=2570319 RepID=UPI001F01F41B|nr:bifunctional hydroxymethylpyrimidine kinase/phosphomethylpyrimidine kinase [Nonomuraea sp. MG754425]MCF6468838.1 bifunctional hydroxymethylpyrimidine kinase/phosphomethylpyrimidine kinase [Nonomuraea sp. MG754425]
MNAVPKVLSIAGTDPSGGAGIQADLKTFSALGAYGMTVVTALVAQTTTGVTGIHEVPAAFVAEQLDTLLADVPADAVKIGMLGNAALIRAVAAALDAYRPAYVVLDPVMVAKSGDRLLPSDAVAELRATLLPRVDLITPNLPEAADLLDEKPAASLAEMHDQAGRLRALGARQVLLKGGHLDGDTCVDVLATPEGTIELAAPRVRTRNTHGTGCTLSSAIAALRPRHDDWAGAVRAAKEYLTGALRAADSLHVGHGHGPVHHFHAIW